MPLACKYCIALKGLKGSEIYKLPKTEDELVEHIEKEHHIPVRGPGETEEQCAKRFYEAYPESRDPATCKCPCVRGTSSLGKSGAELMSELCPYCDEPIEPVDRVLSSSVNQRFHEECFIRMVVGSVAHQLRLCSCFGGPKRDSEVGLSPREAARASYAAFMRRNELLAVGKFLIPNAKN